MFLQPLRPFPGLVLTGLLVALLAPVAVAQKSRLTETEGEFLRYDAARHEVVVKVLRPGKGARPPRELKLRKGTEGVFRVLEEGSVLTRTTVKLQDGTAGRFEDLEAGRKLKIFWIPDPDDPARRFARSISVFVPPEEQGVDAAGE